MKKTKLAGIMLALVIAVMALMPVKLSAQEGLETTESKFALSVNPLGVAQFGPVINAEYSIKENLELQFHVRFPSLGLLSYVLAEDDDGLDEYKGIAFGGGILHFFGKKRNKPFYLGGIIDFQTNEVLYAEDEEWEWTETSNAIAFVCNGGYRFRFNGGFFVNTGTFLGFASVKSEWEYTDTSPGSWGSNDNSSREDSGLILFYMLEVTLGIEF